MDAGHDGTETLWDARDVARYLKVSRSWVYQKAEAGLLPYLKVGRSRAVRPGAHPGVRARLR
jgi:excisionase family DNA binding protein